MSISNREVIKAFCNLEIARNRNLSTIRLSNGVALYSYDTAIAFVFSDRTVILDNQKWSKTTSRHQGLVRQLACHDIIEVKHDQLYNKLVHPPSNIKTREEFLASLL